MPVGAGEPDHIQATAVRGVTMRLGFSVTGKSSFGTFSVTQIRARKGINPATKQSIDLPAVNVPRFKPGRSLKEVVRSI